MRRQIGEHMKRSLMTAATCTTWIEVDMGRVEAARARLGGDRAAVRRAGDDRGAARVPGAERVARGRRYTRHDDVVHLGIAVSLGDDGLIVPVVHDAHELSVEGLAARIRDLARRARARRADAGRGARRHVHDHQPRAVRVDHGDADHQPAAGGDP